MNNLTSDQAERFVLQFDDGREPEPPVKPPETPSLRDAPGQCLLFCHRCGVPMPASTEFCTRCGARRCVSCGDC